MWIVDQPRSSIWLQMLLSGKNLHMSASCPEGSDRRGNVGEKPLPVHEMWLLKQSVEQPNRVAWKIEFDINFKSFARKSTYKSTIPP